MVDLADIFSTAIFELMSKYGPISDNGFNVNVRNE
jgi:hypothetical protein